MTVKQVIGARYVPLFSEPIDWDNTKTYEPLTIVYYGGNSYTSKQAVPKGIDITNTAYWALTGNYNAQIEAYRNEVKQFDSRITENSTINTKQDAQLAGTSNSGLKSLIDYNTTTNTTHTNQLAGNTESGLKTLITRNAVNVSDYSGNTDDDKFDNALNAAIEKNCDLIVDTSLTFSNTHTINFHFMHGNIYFKNNLPITYKGTDTAFIITAATNNIDFDLYTTNGIYNLVLNSSDNTKSATGIKIYAITNSIINCRISGFKIGIDMWTGSGTNQWCECNTINAIINNCTTSIYFDNDFTNTANASYNGTILNICSNINNLNDTVFKTKENSLLYNCKLNINSWFHANGYLIYNEGKVELSDIFFKAEPFDSSSISIFSNNLFTGFGSIDSLNETITCSGASFTTADLTKSFNVTAVRNVGISTPYWCDDTKTAYPIITNGTRNGFSNGLYNIHAANEESLALACYNGSNIYFVEENYGTGKFNTNGLAINPNTESITSLTSNGISIDKPKANLQNSFKFDNITAESGYDITIGDPFSDSASSNFFNHVILVNVVIISQNVNVNEIWAVQHSSADSVQFSGSKMCSCGNFINTSGTFSINSIKSNTNNTITINITCTNASTIYINTSKFGELS